MFAGEKINVTEDRAVLHVALRAPEGERITVDGDDVVPEVHEVLDAMSAFADAVRSGKARGATGKKITDIVNIGIGGSDLGPAMATLALAPYHDGPRTHFVSNVDGAHIADTLKDLDAATTLVHHRLEDLHHRRDDDQRRDRAQMGRPRRWARTPSRHHFAAVSTALDKVAAFGIAPDRVFGFWDWVGGRYSLWSAIGLPIMIAVGPANFRAFLAGAHEMDRHFADAEPLANLPFMLGLVGFWHRVVCGYPARAVIPYDQRLSRLPAYLQQLDMESNGKSVTIDGGVPATPTGPLVWGEPGTNGQHAFFQLLHQGTDVIPVEFIAAANGHEPELRHHHDLLLANCLAQSEALMRGRTLEEARAQMTAKGMKPAEVDKIAPHRVFSGNRPSLTILYEKLDPAHARPADRALRAPRLRRGAAVRHQRLRPVGRRARQGTGDRAAACRRGQSRTPRRAAPRPPVSCAISTHCVRGRGLGGSSRGYCSTRTARWSISTRPGWRSAT